MIVMDRVLYNVICGATFRAVLKIQGYIMTTKASGG